MSCLNELLFTYVCDKGIVLLWKSIVVTLFLLQTSKCVFVRYLLTDGCYVCVDVFTCKDDMCGRGYSASGMQHVITINESL